MNLVQPPNLRLRLSDLLRYARKTFRPFRIVRPPGPVRIRQAELSRAGLLQRVDGRMKPLDLPAQLFLLGDSPVNSIQIERHKFLAAIHEFLRQQAQQRQASFEQRQIGFNFRAHGLRHFVQFVFVFLSGRADIRGARRGWLSCESCFYARLLGWLVPGPGIGV
jgi:hypothetical protein